MHPRSRFQGIASTEVDGELILYDRDRRAAHCLDAAAAVVWRSCDGDTSPAEVAERLRADVDPAADIASVELALARLDEAGLLEAGAPARRPGINRRVALRRIGAAAVAPAVLSIALPSAYAATSCLTGGQACTQNSQCCDNVGFCTHSPGVNTPNCNNCIEAGDDSAENACGPTGDQPSCCSGFCYSDVCCAKFRPGDACTQSTQCCSGVCSGGICN
jgi:hypothetical protein